MIGQALPAGACGSNRCAGTALWVACSVPAAFAVLSLFFWPSHFVALNVEDGVGETTGAACMFAAAWLAGREAWAARRERRAWRSAAWFAAGALVVALEEISWGQRLLGWSFPLLQSRNVQHEINLHNLTFFVHPLQAVLWPTLVVGCAALGVIARMSDRVRGWLIERNVPTPPLQTLPPLLTSLAIVFFPEVAELLFSIAMVVTAGVLRSHRDSAGGARRAWVAVVTCVCVALAVVEFGPHHQRELSRLHWVLTIGEGIYPRLGMMDNSLALLDAEARRFEGWRTFGSAVGPLATIAVKQWRYGSPGEPSPAFLERAIRSGTLLDARASIDLAVLYRLAGRAEEAELRLQNAEELLERHEREGPARGSPSEIEIVARIRLLAARGLRDEAQALLRRHLKRRPEVFVLHWAWIRELSAIFAGEASAAETRGPSRRARGLRPR